MKSSQSKVLRTIILIFAFIGISAVHAEVNSDVTLPTGDWGLHYDWNCKGDVIDTDIALLPDHTYKIPKQDITGTWTYEAQTMTYTAIADKWPHATYTGTFDGKAISGTMRIRQLTGCFTMTQN
jgi:hypothetical protein